MELQITQSRHPKSVADRQSGGNAGKIVDLDVKRNKIGKAYFNESLNECLVFVEKRLPKDPYFLFVGRLEYLKKNVACVSKR